jgi:hypothetical protein
VISLAGFVGSTLKIADSPDGDQWQVACPMGFCGGVGLKENGSRCLPGHVEVVAVADAPFGTGGGSYKIVDYVWVVSVPPELKHIEPYIYTRYRKSATFQKTDRGWRVAQ